MAGRSTGGAGAGRGRGSRAPVSGRYTSIIWSLAAHALLIAVMLGGRLVIPKSPPPAQLAIQATVVDPDTLESVTADREAERRRAEDRQRRIQQEEQRQAEELKRREADEQRRLADEQRRQAQEAERTAREQADAKARQEAEAQAKREAEAKRQAEQKAKQEAEAQAKRDAEEKAKREAEARAERERVEAERKAAEQRRQEEARKAAEEARRQEAAADLARQLAAEEQRRDAIESGALAQYVALIRQRVERNWARPGSARPGLSCEVHVTQIPGGEVVNVRIGACNGDDAVRRSIEAAVMRASPLPPPDDPSLFERNLIFDFKPDE